MSEESYKADRQSTRLSISIPIHISGVDAAGNNFTESVRTLIVNKHGGKIATTHDLAMGTEVAIQNPALGVVTKASVVWVGQKHVERTSHYVGLQLIEAQNVWGIAFPPDDWHSEPGYVGPAVPGNLSASENSDTAAAAPQVTSLASKETTLQLVQELQQYGEALAREFQDRLKQVIHRLGLEAELDPYKPAARASAWEVTAMEGEIKVLKESLSAAQGEIANIETEIQRLKSDLQATTGNLPPTPIQEARRQLADLSNSVVEGMNLAAEAGLRQYRSLLEIENLRSAAGQHKDAEQTPPPEDPSSQS